MIIYPAIDLRNGQCVRLYQGDYQQETVYHSDPCAVAEQFISAGAEWLHLVDLDGAKDPNNHQAALIGTVIKNCNIKIQTGGGIRTQDQVTTLRNKGAERIVIGSLAVKNPTTVAPWFNAFGSEHLALALDIMFDHNQQPRVAVDAWQNASQKSLFELLDYYQSFGLKHVLCTDITKDGTLTGPNFLLYQQLAEQYPSLNIQASGGIHALTDLQLLKTSHIAGVIIGKALYENKFTLSEALSC